MPFIPATRVINSFLSYTGPDLVPLGTSLDFLCGGTVTEADLDDVGSFLASWFDTEMQPLMTAGYVLERIKLRDMTSENSFSKDWVGILPLTGVMAGNSLPSNVAWCLKKQTGRAGRSYRGRIYHPGMGEAQVSGNYVDATYASDVIDAYNYIVDNITGVGQGFEMVVVSYQNNGVPRTSGLATVVTGIVATDLRVDTQRRRLPTG